jgi:hypothetical protein
LVTNATIALPPAFADVMAQLRELEKRLNQI